MLKVRDGQLDKLGLLFERHKTHLYRFYYKMNLDRDLSEDLVQTVFERIVRYRKSFQATGEFSVWMFRIARNVQYDHFRQEKRHPKEAVDDLGDQLEDDTPTIDTRIGKQEEMDLLSLALSRLDAEKREVIILSKLEGIQYKQIAGILGCPEDAVKIKVFRALRKLKQEYEIIQEKV